MKKTLVATSILLVALAVTGLQTAWAEDLSQAQLQALEGAGVPVYPGAGYSSGDEETGAMWFETGDSVDKVMDWYESQLPDWATADVKGRRIVYDGPEGLESKDISTKPYVFALKKHDYPGDERIEITVRIQ